MAKYIY